jgi:hypothetical protein
VTVSDVILIRQYLAEYAADIRRSAREMETDCDRGAEVDLRSRAESVDEHIRILGHLEVHS